MCEWVCDSKATSSVGIDFPSDAPKLILSGAPRDPVYKIEKQCGHDTPTSDTSVDFKSDITIINTVGKVVIKALDDLTRWEGIPFARNIFQRLCHCTLLKALAKSTIFT